MANSKKKKSGRRSAWRESFVFEDTTFYEPCDEPCGDLGYLRAYAGGKGKDGPLSKCVTIEGPAAFIGRIKTALRNAG